MNQHQMIALIFSLLFVMFSLWGRFDDSDRFYNKLLRKENIIVSILLSILFCLVGTSLDFYIFGVNVQTSVYYIPFTFIVFLQIINQLCELINKRKFYAIAAKFDMSRHKSDFVDLFFTLLLILLSFLIPITSADYILNHSFFD
jgi:hypothetical protein